MLTLHDGAGVMDPLDEILEAAGIPAEHPTRVVTQRATHNVVMSGFVLDATNAGIFGQPIPTTSSYLTLDDLETFEERRTSWRHYYEEQYQPPAADPDELARSIDEWTTRQIREWQEEQRHARRNQLILPTSY